MKVRLTYSCGVTEVVDPIESGLFESLDGVTISEIVFAYFDCSGDYGRPVDVEILEQDKKEI